MDKQGFNGKAVMTPKYSKGNPIILQGDFKYDQEKDCYISSNVVPRCYADIFLNANIIKKLS